MPLCIKLLTQFVQFQDKYEHVADKNDKLEEQINSLSSSFLSFKVAYLHDHVLSLFIMISLCKCTIAIIHEHK